MDNNIDPTNQQHLQKPLLKKVKRPINRIMPQVPQNSSVNITQNDSNHNTESLASNKNPFQQENLANRPQNPEQPIDEHDAFDLDSYLDDDTGLPVKNNISDDLKTSETPKFIEEEDLVDNNDSYYRNGNLPPYLTKNVLILLGAVLFFVGVLSGMFLFSEEKVVRNGLQGVVVNPEVPRGRARCGVAERTQGCVLYIMNPQRQELNARDFYDLASQLTGRQRFVIETGNMRYSNTKIRPGNIVQLNIPPL